MITGFNTDVEHDGIVYHVQTEDKGLESPIILSLVYSGGAILASKRSPYQDLIASGFSDEMLAERLKRQHRLICAAIHSGRLDDLKKMSGRVGAGETGPLTGPLTSPDSVEAEVTEPNEVTLVAEPEVVKSDDAVETVQDVAAVEDATPEDVIAVGAVTSFEDEIVRGIDAEQEFIRDFSPRQEEIEAQQGSQEFDQEAPLTTTEQEPVPQQPSTEAYTVYDPRRAAEYVSSQTGDGVVITLLDEEEFYSGDKRMLRVFISERRGAKEKPLANMTVSIKILGTAFRPLIFSIKTERDGVAAISTEIPQFTSGRAAVLIRVVAKESTAELRRVIHPAS